MSFLVLNAHCSKSQNQDIGYLPVIKLSVKASCISATISSRYRETTIAVYYFMGNVIEYHLFFLKSAQKWRVERLVGWLSKVCITMFWMCFARGVRISECNVRFSSYRPESNQDFISFDSETYRVKKQETWKHLFQKCSWYDELFYRVFNQS